MKVQALIRQIEDAFNEKWTGKRFKDISEVHDDFRRIANQFIPRNIEVGVWDIHEKKSYLKLLEYSFDIVEDKRYKMTVAGRINSISIKKVKELKASKDVTLDELIVLAEKLEAEKAVENTLEKLQSLKLDVVKYETQLKEREEHLATYQ